MICRNMRGHWTLAFEQNFSKSYVHLGLTKMMIPMNNI